MQGWNLPEGSAVGAPPTAAIFVICGQCAQLCFSKWDRERGSKVGAQQSSEILGIGSAIFGEIFHAGGKHHESPRPWGPRAVLAS